MGTKSSVYTSIKAFIIRSITSFSLFLVNSCYTSYFFSGQSPVEVAPTFQFKVGSSSATITDSMSEVIAFFTRFDLFETNDLDPSEFWVLELLT